jgi:SAM-dependent methyltransferase
MDRAHWRRFAAEWTAWARKPGHDAFWAYRKSLLGFIGRGRSQALEIGCGEGRVSRALKELGYRVTASDPVPELVEAAAGLASAHRHVVADAAMLPFPDRRFHLVVAYNVLMDVEDVPAVAREIARVLAPDGECVVSLVHPFRDRGRFAGPEADAPFVLAGSYFGRERFEDSEERDGVQMHFAGWSQPLENYAAALADAGLAITAIREPRPDADGPAHLAQWARVPLFLWMKARRLPRVRPDG